MTSKALFFKLMKEDFKKKIWIIVLGLIVSLFVNPIRVLMHIENTLVTNPLVDHKVMTDIIFYDLLPYNVGMSVVPAVIAFLLAIVGFSYLFNKKKVDLYHSLPIKRERLFLIIYLNGIISFLIVSVITSFVLILAIMSKGYLTVNILSTIGSILIATIIYFLLFYHVAIVAVMLTGNIITAALGSGVLYLYGWLMQDLLQNYFNQCFVSSYRINTDIIDYIPIISPVSSLIQWISIYNDVADINGGKLTLCLINALIQGVIALIVAIILYKKRESEVAGKAMAFKFAQPVIKVLLMLMLTLMGGLYCSLFARNGYNSLFWYWFGFIVAAILSHCIIEIIYHADFKACFQRKLQSCVIIAAAALIGSCFQYDLLGYDRYLPDENQVEYCSVNFDNINSELEPYKIKEDESGKKVLQYT
ncbi:MAG: hypothetical protein GX567_14150, partial [Clostridia bacterium]|nr:hypothetical protein [Clostridia bacterium]